MMIGMFPHNTYAKHKDSVSTREYAEFFSPPMHSEWA